MRCSAGIIKHFYNVVEEQETRLVHSVRLISWFVVWGYVIFISRGKVVLAGQNRHPIIIRQILTKTNKVITTVVIRSLNDPTLCAQSVVADLQSLRLG